MTETLRTLIEDVNKIYSIQIKNHFNTVEVKKLKILKPKKYMLKSLQR